MTKTAALLAWMILTCFPPGAESLAAGLEVYWCDVEGGAATVIVTPSRESILVDSGWAGERDPGRIAHVVKDIAGLRQIDHYVTTHWHADHFGGIERLAHLVPVGRFYDHGLPAALPRDINSELMDAYKRLTAGRNHVLKPGDRIPLRQVTGGPFLSLEVLAADGRVAGEAEGAPPVGACPAQPAHEAKPPDTSDNAKSVAFVLQLGDWQFFDAGDLTWNVEHKLVCPEKLVTAVDVYQVTHHGMDTSNHPALLRALQPRVAVMNNGSRKGGSSAVVRALKSLDSLQGLFALHRNISTTSEDNAAPEHTANDEEQCAGNHVKLSVAPDARSYTVEVPSKGTVRTFQTR